MLNEIDRFAPKKLKKTKQTGTQEKPSHCPGGKKTAKEIKRLKKSRLLKTIFAILIGIVLVPKILFSETTFNEMLSAAKKGDSHAQFLIGFTYFSGKYMDGSTFEINYSEAIKWIELSAKNGYSYAQFHLGGMYSEGKGVLKNEKTGAKWFLKAAKSGNIKARYNIAICYYYGTGLEKNDWEAYAWAGLAGLADYEPAKPLAATILSKLYETDYVNNHKRANEILFEYLQKFGKGNTNEK